MPNDCDYTCSLDEVYIQKAKSELNEDPETRLTEVINLRKRLQKIPGLKANTEVVFLLGFLRARKFDQEQTVQLIKSHYEVKKIDKAFFLDFKPSRVKGLVDAGVIEVLEHRNSAGCLVLVYRPEKWNIDEYPIMEVVKLMVLVLTYATKEEQTQVCGVHIVDKQQGLSLKQAHAMTPAVASKLLNFLQDAMPLRLRRIDFTHEPPFFDAVFAIVKPFLKLKYIDRLHFNGQKLLKLHSAINPDHLPTDLGGKVPPYHNKKWLNDFLASDSMFEEDSKFGFVTKSFSMESIKGRDSGMSRPGGTSKNLDS